MFTNKQFWFQYFEIRFVPFNVRSMYSPKFALIGFEDYGSMDWVRKHCPKWAENPLTNLTRLS